MFAARVHGGVIFTDPVGDFLDDAGIAYLPRGPHPGLENGSFESPVFRRIEGPWYRWTASW